MDEMNNPIGTQQESTISDFENLFASTEDVQDSVEEQSDEVIEEHEELEELEDTEHDDDSAIEADEESDDDDNDDDDHEAEADSAVGFDDNEFTITVDGEEIAVKGSELKSGYMRQSAFTKKTQELAKEREALNARLCEVNEQANVVTFQATNKLNSMNDAIQKMGGWEGIRKQYAPEQVEQFTQMYVTAQQEAGVAEKITQEYRTHVETENKRQLQATFKGMFDTIPSFNVDTMKELAKYVEDVGYPEEVAMGIVDPISWNLIYKAMQYDKAQVRRTATKSDDKKQKVATKRHHSAPVSKKPVSVVKTSSVKKALDKQKATIYDRKANSQASFEAFQKMFG